MIIIDETRELLNVILKEIMYVLTSLNQLHLNIYFVLAIALLFLFLHGQRNTPILRNLSIMMGFLPVLIHEVGHAVTASATGGRVENIYMVLTEKKQRKIGAQGYASYYPGGRLSNIITVFMGYVAPPSIMLLGVTLITNDLSIIFIIILFAMTLYYFWHTSQKWIPFTLAVILAFSGSTAFFELTTWTPVLIGLIHSIVLGLLLGETIQSVIIITKVLFLENNTKWDGHSLKELTKIPASFWYLIWVTISILAIYYSVTQLISWYL